MLRFWNTNIFALLTIVLVVSPSLAQEKEVAKESLIGTWKVDFEKSTDIPDGERAQMEMMGIRITFAKEGVLTFQFAGQTMNGKYATEAVEGKDDQLKLTMDVEGDEQEATLYILEEGRIKIDPESDTALVFQRVDDEAKDEKGQTDLDKEKLSMDDIKKMLVGNWKIDEEATMEFEGNKGEEVVNFPPIDITMRKDGTGDFGEHGSSKPGTYKVREKEEGEGLELVTIVDDDERVFEFVAINKDHFAMRPGSNRPYYVFKKEKKEGDDE